MQAVAAVVVPFSLRPRRRTPFRFRDRPHPYNIGMDTSLHMQPRRDTRRSDLPAVLDDEIMGGTPVIRSTRMTVYSVLGRVEHGDTIDDILPENPPLSRPVVEAAVTYARTHPFVDRPCAR